MTQLQLDHIEPLQQELESHRIYAALRDVSDLRIFMQHHIYSVWDFMSLIKYLQQQVAPVRVPWTPVGDPAVRYFINQLVLEEESDCMDRGAGPEYGSHFELYTGAMAEIGADASPAIAFVEQVARGGLREAIRATPLPRPARDFMETTFCFIDEDKPHEVAAALALGRERVIPQMFRRLLSDMDITEADAPSFHYYLKRHIHLDEDFHGPLSLQLLEHLCGDDPEKHTEAEAAAEEAICARIRFWDGVLEAIETARG
ncbi:MULTISPECIES: DUF3050 domain-containing protein [Thiorhodovibrio]|uniref:DUF3050 domain-containing protein n=1 Tax=Thiorhodovibrio TaxID=61593 RepID=UPI001911E1B8|nr:MULTISPECIES: DUF3050 domain-containing protein [Thiorhodovibrio]MBK5970570.1 heme oxygenase [Thiorhodovibrio winogradskyi]WPL12804.1 hypothetical protein Thiosp_02583 [Thiorhodovibrio litoralis]